MSVNVSIRELRERLGPILETVESGEQIVITRRGKPIARIIPEPSPAADRSSRYPLRGSVLSMSDDFDEPVIDLWEDLAS